MKRTTPQYLQSALKKSTLITTLPPPLPPKNTDEVLIDIPIMLPLAASSSSSSSPEVPTSMPESPLLGRSRSKSISEIYSETIHYEKDTEVKSVALHFYMEKTNAAFRIVRRWPYTEWPVDVYLVFTLENGDVLGFQYQHDGKPPPEFAPEDCAIERINIFQHKKADFADMIAWCRDNQYPNTTLVTKQEWWTRLICRCRVYSPPVGVKMIESKHQFIIDFLNEFADSPLIPNSIKSADQLYRQILHILKPPI